MGIGARNRPRLVRRNQGGYHSKTIPPRSRIRMRIDHCLFTREWMLPPAAVPRSRRSGTYGRALALAITLALLPPVTRAAEQEAHHFFPFCIDWHDAKKRSFAEQAQMLK